MKKILIASIILFLAMLAQANPSDLIKTAPLPGVISLSGTVSSSLNAISATNPNLTRQEPWKMADIGTYYSYTKDEVQEDNAGIPKSLQNFSNTITPIPNSIGNSTNATNLTGEIFFPEF